VLSDVSQGDDVEERKGRRDTATVNWDNTNGRVSLR
jgi:hypothetical protein